MARGIFLERATRFELATLTLARCFWKRAGRIPHSRNPAFAQVMWATSNLILGQSWASFVSLAGAEQERNRMDRQ